MKPETAYIDWDKLPDILTKEQFYRLAHVSKKTARELLVSGTVPCINNGKKTHCYEISKADARAYIERPYAQEHREENPISRIEAHADIPEMTGPLPKETKNSLHAYYTLLLSDCTDLLTTMEVIALTGYTRATVNGWCRDRRVSSFICRNTYHITKASLIDFLCTNRFRGIIRKTEWHKQTLLDFMESQRQL